jgi:N-acyl amino acid synthase of PEP-CTERM/exosortase system
MSSSPVTSQNAESRDSGAGPKTETGMGKPRLKDIYDGYFQIVQAKTEEQRQLAFRLRYQVYCVEHPYEDPAQNPGEMEKDALDDASLHALLMHRRSDSLVGAVRLILPQKDDREMRLPIRNVCRHEFIVQDRDELPRSRTAEISRFAISKDFRRRAQEDTSVGHFTMPGDDPRRVIPNTSLGLMQAVVAMAAQEDVSHLCAVMEPFLLRMLRKLGIHFHKMGPEVEYHGQRQPCYSDLDELLTRIWLERRDVWELITDDGKLWPLNSAVAVPALAATAA